MFCWGEGNRSQVSKRIVSTTKRDIIEKANLKRCTSKGKLKRARGKREKNRVEQAWVQRGKKAVTKSRGKHTPEKDFSSEPHTPHPERPTYMTFLGPVSARNWGKAKSNSSGEGPNP